MSVRACVRDCVCAHAPLTSMSERENKTDKEGVPKGYINTREGVREGKSVRVSERKRERGRVRGWEGGWEGGRA